MIKTATAQVITARQVLDQWQGHRRLTRRVIAAFPEKELFEFTIGGMRPFAWMAEEMIKMSGPGVKGLATGIWENLEWTDHSYKTKDELLKAWDDTTEVIEEVWNKIPPYRFQDNDLAFGAYEGPLYATLLYFIDNEVHHRGQGYVYLRALGIEPPAFWMR